jgi:phosphatidylinositol alpha-1,6-mannosyltransferase
MSWPALAAISLNARGGGVARVSCLIQRVFAEHWGHTCRLKTLTSGDDLRSTTLDRVTFGAEIAAAQALGHCRWVFYSHVRIARVQAFIPPAFRRPYAVFLHGIEAWRPLTRTERRVLEGATLLVANSAYTARRVAQAHPWIGPIAACPLALVPPDASGPSRGGYPAAMQDVPRLGPHAVLVVARMSAAERYKGHDELLDAWPAVLARVPDAQLVFVGEGDDVARLKARAARVTSPESVLFTGFVSEAALDALYRRAAVFAMPSRDEGLGLVYLEAMAHGLPCIGSVHDAAAEVIDDGVTGYLVDQSNAAQLADRIGALLADEAMRLEMGARGLARGQRRFTYGQFRDRLLSLVLASFGRWEPAAAARVVPAAEMGRSRP